MDNSRQNNNRNGPAIALIGLGVLLLVGQIFGGGALAMLWPLFIVAPGAFFLYIASTGEGKSVGMAVPGAVISGTGAILFYQNLTGHWESWAYIWTLYSVFVGLALSYMGRRSGNERESRTGHGLVRWGTIAFAVLGILFELLIFRGFGGFFGGWVGPLLLVGLGAYLLTKGRTDHTAFARFNGKSKRKHPFADSAGNNLRRKIDEALAADDEPVITDV
jgi:hypothetical protein